MHDPCTTRGCLTRTAAAIVAAALLAPAAHAQFTVGDALVQRYTADYRPGMIAETPFAFPAAAFGQSVASFSFFNAHGPALGQITPLVLDGSVGGVFTVLGVGTQRTAAVGLNTFAFGLTSGSAILVGGTTRVGYYAPFGQNGVVDVCVAPNSVTCPGSTETFAFTAANAAVPVAGGTYPVLDTYARFYSIQFSTLAKTVPEPSTLALLTVGFAGLGGLGVRRRQTTRAALPRA